MCDTLYTLYNSNIKLNFPSFQIYILFMFRESVMIDSVSRANLFVEPLYILIKLIYY